MNKPNYQSEVCQCCGQTTTYLLPIDTGTCDIVKAFAAAVKNKGINLIHPTRDMEVPHKEWSYERAIHAGVLTSTQIGNLTRARVHGLLARVMGHPGYWCITRKGINFLNGSRIPQFAIVSKSKANYRSHKEDYFKPDDYSITIGEITKEHGNYWVGINFDLPPHHYYE